nr:hypothetical protein GCM10020063_067970 [Dactylosporangium thailandense]
MSLLSALDSRHTVAPEGYSRWLIPPAALAVHLCIGQAYATSVYKNSLIAHFGASQTAIGIIFSIAIVMLGLSAAVGGTWVERNGPRKAMFVSACFWGAGFLVAALGIGTKQLWLVYCGYGVLGGIGLGIGYISPVSTLIKWFPDRPGLATGLAIMGFGGGALIASPLSRQLLSLYDAGYNPDDAKSVAGGAALVLLFVTLGLGYCLIMMFGVFNVRVPREGWRPAGFDPASIREQPMVTTASVSAANALRTRSFYMIYLGVGMVLYALLASVGHTATALFVLLAGVILSFYGGGFATVPAYLRDLFGTYQVGAIHGRLLTAWSAAGVAGPLIVNGFLDAQGKPGTLTASAYQPALFTMVGVLAAGFIANLLIRPVPQRFHEPVTAEPEKVAS